MERGSIAVRLITHAAHARSWLAVAPFCSLDCVAVAVDSSPHGASESSCDMEEHAQHESVWNAVQQLHQGGAVQCLVFNLFALEAFHIAERLRVRCMAVAAYQVPYQCPPEFKRRFAAAFGQKLLNRLVSSSSPSRVSWAEVCHWMWPLFTERWHRLRVDVLGLAPSPLHDATTGDEVDELPPPVPLVYGYSELVVPRPGYLPASVVITSFWLPREEWLGSSGGAGAQLPPALVRLLGVGPPAIGDPVVEAAGAGAGGRAGGAGAGGAGAGGAGAEGAGAGGAGAGGAGAGGAGAGEAGAGGEQAPAGPLQPPVCIDVASSGQLGLLRDPKHLLAVVCGALATVGRRAVVLTSGFGPLHDAYAELEAAAQQRLLLHDQPVPHQVLLRACCLVVHPGGSGTTAACLSSGTPQLTFPLHFDQRFWAQLLAYLGLSPEPLSVQDLFEQPSTPGLDPVAVLAAQVQTLARRMREGLAEDVQAACQQVAADLAAGVDGVAAAVDLVLERCRMGSRSSGAEQAASAGEDNTA